MMKLKYSICCGLDVHKNVIVATIVTTNKDGISEYLQKSFSTINSDIQRFHNWLIENNCYHVCMESTGKYWIPIFNYLENDIDVCLTHPKYVKAIKGKKTDKKDSKWIADIGNGHTVLDAILLGRLHADQLETVSGKFPKLTKIFWRNKGTSDKIKFVEVGNPFRILLARQQLKSSLIYWSILLIPWMKKLSANS